MNRSEIFDVVLLYVVDDDDNKWMNVSLGSKKMNLCFGQRFGLWTDLTAEMALRASWGILWGSDRISVLMDNS